MSTDDPRQEGTTNLIRELAVRPPVKGMANVKAATEVFVANLPEVESETSTPSHAATFAVSSDRRS